MSVTIPVLDGEKYLHYAMERATGNQARAGIGDSLAVSRIGLLGTDRDRILDCPMVPRRGTTNEGVAG